MLIGLAGNKGVGKDTVGQYLVANYSFTKIAFADKLKEAVANLFGIDLQWVDAWKEWSNLELIIKHDKLELAGMKWRTFLQRFGTEMGRNTFGKNFWLDLWAEDFKDIQLKQVRNREPINVVVTDVRFPNEAACILAQGGWVIEITRPNHTPDGHASEEGIDEKLVDALIINNGSIEDLYKDVDQLMEEIVSGRRQLPGSN